MELLMATGALMALDVLARFFGFDSRDVYDRAIDAAHRGDLAGVPSAHEHTRARHRPDALDLAAGAKARRSPHSDPRP